MMWIAGLLQNQFRGIGLHLELISSTPCYFAFLRLHHFPSKLVTVFLGSLWRSIKQINAHYVFGNTELICKQCWGIRPHFVEKGKSHGFSGVAAGTWVIFSSYGGDDTSKLVFVHRYQDSCLLTRDTSGITSRLARAILKLLEVRRETQCPFLIATVILGFLSIFNKSQASSPVEALNSVCL